MIRIIQPGFGTNLQAPGRSGYRHLGVSQSGALNPQALAIANLLVGNTEHSTVIEFTAGRLEISVSQDCALAICAHHFKATRIETNNRSKAAKPLPLNQAFLVRPSHSVVIEPDATGSHAYIGFAGGIRADRFFGSTATNLAAGFGGHCGRLLQAGDELVLAEAVSPQRLVQMTAANVSARLDLANNPIRAIPGPEFGWLTQQAQQAFWQTAWQIGDQSSRMGCRLQGPHQQIEKSAISSGSMLSHGTLPGTVQLPPSGQPIVLLADAQTTGGYPRIATVITADLWKFAQMPRHSHFQFVHCDQQQAVVALQQQQYALNRFKIALKNRFLESQMTSG